MTTYNLCCAIMERALNNAEECTRYSRKRWPLHCAARYYRCHRQMDKAFSVADGTPPTPREISHYLGKGSSDDFAYTPLSDADLREMKAIRDHILQILSLQ